MHLAWQGMSAHALVMAWPGLAGMAMLQPPVRARQRSRAHTWGCHEGTSLHYCAHPGGLQLLSFFVPLRLCLLHPLVALHTPTGASSWLGFGYGL